MRAKFDAMKEMPPGSLVYLTNAEAQAWLADEGWGWNVDVRAEKAS